MMAPLSVDVSYRHERPGQADWFRIHHYHGQFNKLPEAEKKYWHYHKIEVARAHATFPDLTQEEAAKILPAVHETYGKVIYFQKPEDKYPIGEPYVVIVQQMPEQD